MQRILRRRDVGVHSPQAPVHPEPAYAPAPPEPAANAAPPAAAVPNGTVAGDATAPGGAVDPAPMAGGPTATTPDGAADAAAPAGVGGASPPAAADPAAAPAGVDPAAVADAGPSFRDRGRLRRRLRFLRRLRELGFRDLGGLVFDQHRFDRPDAELVRGKLTALAAVDAELRALERALHDHVPITELREPGISACARCGAVIASDARFCSTCGTPVGGARAVPGVGGLATPETPESTPPAVAPAADEQPTVASRPVDRPS